MERNGAPKLNKQASMAAKQDRPLSEEEKMIAMEIAARIQARIRSGALAKEEDEVPIKEEKEELHNEADEKPTDKPEEAPKEEKIPTA